jgi:hypothetical protein
MQLSTVKLSKGLKEIGCEAFYECMLLNEVTIPRVDKAIKHSAFYQCAQMTIAILGKGLEEIGLGAFWVCKSLQEILIPFTVKSIKN